MKKSMLFILILGLALFAYAQDPADPAEEVIVDPAEEVVVDPAEEVIVDPAEEVIVDPVADLLLQAEVTHEAKDYDATMELLQQAYNFDSKNVEILWKISRGYFDFADRKPNDMDYKKPFLYKGREFAEKALALDDKSAAAHKWYAIHHGQVGEAEGTEQKIKNSYGMRDHTLLAIKYDPTDDANYHVMGRWHYALSDLSWIERQIASLIYATPPEASFEEALEFFNKAHALDSKDIRNMLYIGYCYSELDDDGKAETWFRKAINAKADTDSDRTLQADAQEALDDL